MYAMDARHVDTTDALISTDCRTGKNAHDPSLTDVVVYHACCPDGFAAAFAAWKLLGDRALYVAAEHGPTAPLNLPVHGKRVVVLDYCFSSAITRRMISEATSFLVLDHHASAVTELCEISPAHKVLEMKQSGATLSWNYFHGLEVPALFRYIEDKDIWRWALPKSQEFSAGFTLPFEFSAWDAFLSQGQLAVDHTIAKGSAILEYKETVKTSHVARAVPCVLNVAPHLNGMIVNTSTMASEIGNALASLPGVDFAFLWNFSYASSSYVCSLRSASDAVDVSAIARAFGGGGHKRAAGFSFTGDRLEDLFKSIHHATGGTTD
jgi:hypothetical protein